MAAPVKRSIAKPGGLRQISKPTMQGKVSGDLTGGMPGKRASSMDVKRNMAMDGKKPVDLETSSKFFTNDTLLMDTTPGMSGEEKRRRKQKERLGSNLLQSSTVNMYEA